MEGRFFADEGSGGLGDGPDDGKALGAYRTIGEVSKWLCVESHVLRSWEQHFAGLRSVKRVAGRRYYSDKDCEFLRYIHGKLSKEGYTIKGVKVLLKEGKKEEVKEGNKEGNKEEGGKGVSEGLRHRIIKLRSRLIVL